MNRYDEHDIGIAESRANLLSFNLQNGNAR